MLSDFKRHIDAKIREQGLAYFKAGKVTYVEDLGDGIYEMIVEDPDAHTVNLALVGEVVTRYECDCIDDGGPVCKHIAAALYYLRKNIFASGKSYSGTRQFALNGEPIIGQVEKILDALSHEELKVYIDELCMNDSKFKELFLTKHIHLLHPESKVFYSKKLQALINSFKNKQGKIDNEACKRLVDEVDKITEEASRAVEKGQFRKPMFIAIAVIEEIVGLMWKGYFEELIDVAGPIYTSLEILDELVVQDINETQHDELFDNLLALYEIEELRGYGFDLQLIESAVKLAGTSREKELLMSALYKVGSNRKNYGYANSQELMLKLIEVTECEATVDFFIEDNISFPLFREKSIEKARIKKDYVKVEELAKEGIAIDENIDPRQADKWRNYLLEAYYNTGNVKNAIQLAHDLLIYSEEYSSLSYCHKVLKSFVPEDQWQYCLSNLVDDIIEKNHGVDYDRIEQIYIWDSNWDKLYELLNENASLERVLKAEDYLKDTHSEKMIILYKKLIIEYLDHNVGLEHYKNIDRYIFKMRWLGSPNDTTEFIQELKLLYPKRKELHKILDK